MVKHPEPTDITLLPVADARDPMLPSPNTRALRLVRQQVEPDAAVAAEGPWRGGRGKLPHDALAAELARALPYKRLHETATGLASLRNARALASQPCEQRARDGARPGRYARRSWSDMPLLRSPLAAVLALSAAVALLFSFGQVVQAGVLQAGEHHAESRAQASDYWRCNLSKGAIARADCLGAPRPTRVAIR